jgi:general L-amino acid transport system substrate-binding protein
MTSILASGLRWTKLATASAVLATALVSTSANAGPTLDRINQRGAIKVGVGTTPGFFAPDSSGRWQGFFIDYGRALSIAVFGDPEKVEFTSSSPQQRLPALQAGEFDILLSGVTVTITRAFQLGFHFGPTIFYDGQGILVRKDLGVEKAADLDGATIGIQSGTTGELNIADFFRKTGHSFTPVTIEDTGEFIAALESGRVDAITQDSSDLVGKLTQLKKPDDYVVLPERLSKEPLAPAIAGGDRLKNGASPARMSTSFSRARTRRSSASSALTSRWARRSASIRNGPTTSSRRWAITARSSIAI